MNHDEAKQRIELLRKEIRRHDRLYYVQADQEISDRAYDEFLAELKYLETEHPDLLTTDSPTQRVRETPLAGFTPVKHEKPMLSLDNTYSYDDVRAFDKRIHDALKDRADLGEVCYTIEPKVDGLSLKVKYVDGVLQQAATRGDGEVGDDVTANVRTIRSVPLRLAKEPTEIEARGEVYMSVKTWEKQNEIREAAGEAKLANPRNAAAGSLRQLDPKVTATRGLDAVFYYLMQGDDSFGPTVQDHFNSHSETLEFLKQMGLPVVPYWKATGIDAAIAKIEELLKMETSLPYQIDGAVLKVDSFAQRQVIGFNANAPKWAFAYKYSHEQAETKCKAITIQVGRTGTLTPVAELEPVQVAGVIVSRATLHNEDEVKRKDIRVGDTVVVERAGCVIPAIMSVIMEKRPAGTVPFDMMLHTGGKCPDCGGPISKDPEFVDWNCDSINCPARLKRSIRHFCCRQAMDIDGLGDQLVEQLVENNLVKDIADLFTITKEQVATLEHMADKSAENTITAIGIAKSRELWRLLHGLGILHVGESMSRKLATHFHSLDRLRVATIDELYKVEDVGPSIATSIVSFFGNSSNLEVIERLRQGGVHMEDSVPVENAPPKAGPFSDKAVCVTGKLTVGSRSQVQDLLRALGARVVDSVSKKTDYLIAGEDAGSKLEKAKKLGVSVLSEAQFEELAKS